VSNNPKHVCRDKNPSNPLGNKNRSRNPEASSDGYEVHLAGSFYLTMSRNRKRLFFTVNCRTFPPNSRARHNSLLDVVDSQLRPSFKKIQFSWDLDMA
jgi:hypothetical protein